MKKYIAVAAIFWIQCFRKTAALVVQAATNLRLRLQIH